MTTEAIGVAGDLVVGAAAIARVTGLKKKQVFHLAARDQLPGTFKLGSHLAMSQAAYQQGLAAMIAASRQALAA